MKGVPPSLNALKIEAKELKKASGGKHSDCLEQTARSYGFPNFNGAVSFYRRHGEAK